MIIGLAGLAGSGKDTVADFLVKYHCFEKLAFADPMKAFCKEMFAFTDEQLHGKAKELPDPRYNGITPRKVLQTLGTEFGRACYQDLWVDYALRKAGERLRFYRSDGAVISDVRFKNERDAIWKAGGKVWRVVRPGAGLVGATASHVSENELTDEMPYDRVIDNKGGTLEDLQRLVARAISGAT